MSDRTRPPPTSYRDEQGRYHPAPDTPAFPEHVASCEPCKKHLGQWYTWSHGAVKTAAAAADHSINPEPCPHCKHRHAGIEAANICIGCPCAYRPCGGVGQATRAVRTGEIQNHGHGFEPVYLSHCGFCDKPFPPDDKMPLHWMVPWTDADVAAITFKTGRVMFGVEPGVSEALSRLQEDLVCDGEHPIPRCASPQCYHRDPRAGEARAPHIVVLCGSTRFYSEFQRANYEETMRGHIVLSVGFVPDKMLPGPSHTDTGRAWAANKQHSEDVVCTPDQKLALDELHKRKIDLADEVIVLNVGGYIGNSTASEIAYAEEHGKPIRWLEPPLDLCGCCHYPLGDGDMATTLVAIDDGDRAQVWHLTCAQKNAEATP